MRDLLGPTHVGHVQEPINALFNLHERAIGGQVAHAALNHGTHGVVVINHVPRIALRLLHTQGNFHLLVVDLQHNDFNFIANRNQFAGMVDAFGPGHFRNVHEALDTFFELDEGSIGHHVDYAALESLALGVTVSNTIPGGGGFLLEAQGNSLPIEIHLEHDDLKFLVHLDHFAGMIHPAPGHVSDVQEAVNTTQVHEHTKFGNVLDHTGAYLALLDVAQKILLQLGPLVFHQLAPGDNDVHALHVHLDDHRPHGLVNQIANLDGTAQRNLTCGQKDVDALHIHKQTALDLALDDALHDVAFAVLLADLFPGTQTIRAALGNDRHVVVVQALVVDLKHLTHFRPLLTKLAERDLAFGLAADVHDNHARTLIYRIDLGIHDLAGLHISDIFTECGVEFIGCQASERGIEASLDFILVQFVLPDPAGNNCHV